MSRLILHAWRDRLGIVGMPFTRAAYPCKRHLAQDAPKIPPGPREVVGGGQSGMSDKDESLRRFKEAARVLAKRIARMEFMKRTLAEIEAEEKRRADARKAEGEGET